MRWTQGIATEIRSIPFATILNAFWTRYSTMQVPAISNHVMTRILGRRLTGKLMPRLKKPLTIWAARPFRALRAQYGLDPEGAKDLFSVMEAGLMLLADIPEFSATESLPPHCHYVGPILCESAWKDWSPPGWLDELDPKRPTVYVTQGSTGSPRLFEEAATALANTSYQVIMTTAGKLRNGRSFPENVRAVDFAPGLRIMDRSDVVVCHGGNGTVNQAILTGCPIVGLPGHVDQSLNIARVQELGMGIELESGKGFGRRLSRALETVILDPSYREAARRMQRVAARFDGPVAAAALLHRYVEEVYRHRNRGHQDSKATVSALRSELCM
jgi:MGT family glycosyltransferase